MLKRDECSNKTDDSQRQWMIMWLSVTILFHTSFLSFPEALLQYLGERPCTLAQQGGERR